MRVGRITMLTLALTLTALTDSHAVRFVHPKARVLIGHPRGVVIPVQTIVTPHPDNRAFVLRWQGDDCEGSSSKTLDGEYERGLQPLEPLKVRVGYGTCAFVAAVFAPGGKLRAKAELEVRVCGGELPCGGV